MILKIYRFAYRLFLYAYILSRVNKLKQKLMRFLIERNKPVAAVGTYRSIEELTEDTFRMRWIEDGWRNGWDMVSRPEVANWRVLFDSDNTLDKSGFDCDEFAIVHTARITKSLSPALTFQGRKIISAALCSVFWTEGYKCVGHNVSALMLQKEDGGVEFSYIDYNLDSPVFNNTSDMARYVVARYSSNSGTLILAVLQDLNLTPFACIV